MESLSLEVLDTTINLYHIDIKYKKDIILVITQYMLQYNNDQFISITCNDNEISIITDSKIEKYLLDIEYLVYRNYKCIKIYDTTDNINQCGVVARISNELAKINISILYINSFNNNYIIIEEKYMNQALEHLNRII